jgi:hypothetical protein
MAGPNVRDALKSDRGPCTLVTAMPEIQSSPSKEISKELPQRKSLADPLARIYIQVQDRMNDFFGGKTAIFSRKVSPDILFEWRKIPQLNCDVDSSDNRHSWRKTISRNTSTRRGGS